jgi:5-hydroxyisourate hydrolase
MISTHILDTSKGVPAPNIPVKLQIQSGKDWKDVAAGSTNADGRHSFECEKIKGVYRLVFDVESYLKSAADDYFYQSIPVVFKIENTARKYHVPLLLNPFGYSTYRGS